MTDLTRLRVLSGIQPKLDEGLFTDLKGTLASVGAGQKLSADTPKLDDKIAEVYQNEKTRAELELLMKNIKQSITDFEVIEKDAATIIKQDPEVAKEMELFATLFNKLLSTLSTRLAVKVIAA